MNWYDKEERDRPATGRAFLLFKSENDDAAQIAAAIKRLSKSKVDVYADIVANLCDRHIFKILGAGDVLYEVRGEDMTSPLYKTLDEAVALVTRIVRGEIMEGRRKAGKPVDDPYGPPVEDMPPTANGATSPMAEDPDPELRRQMQPKKSGLWQRHAEAKSGGVRIDNRVWPSTKSTEQRPRVI